MWKFCTKFRCGDKQFEGVVVVRSFVVSVVKYRSFHRYKHHLSEVRKVGRQRGITGGLSLFAAYFALFSTFALAFWYVVT